MEFNMTFVEWIAFGGTMAAILGIFVGIYALINNRVIKSELFSTRQLIKEEMAANRLLLEKIEEGQEDFKKSFTEAMKHLGDLIVADGERTRQLIRELKSA